MKTLLRIAIPLGLISLAGLLYWTIQSDSAEFDPFVTQPLESCAMATELLGSEIQVVDHSHMEWDTAAGAGAASGTFHLVGSTGAAEARTTLEQHAARWSVTSCVLVSEETTLDVSECF